MRRHPLLYQLNTRVFLTHLSNRLRRKATLADIPESFLNELVDKGVHILWLLSVWTTGPRSEKESRSNPQWIRQFELMLEDLQPQDIGGSGFAIADYRVSEPIGGSKELAQLRDRLNQRGIRLMLDFVPNHMGLDHPWLNSHPEYLIQATQEQLDEQPQNYFQDEVSGKIFAHGRDPYFDGWSDTVQLDYSNSDLRSQMQSALLAIAGQCDAVRCDMAMLLTPRVFERTWGRSMREFWGPAIRAVKARYPGFEFLAEVYWDMEWELQEEGFDYCYDKRLYDRLKDRDFVGVRNHLKADIAYQSKLARFLENHDEPRAASALDWSLHQPAAIATYLSPGLRFFHHGQWQGNRTKISPHLIRAPDEIVDPSIELFYNKLVALLDDPIFHHGDWELLNIERAWDENWSSDCLLSWVWHEPQSRRVVVCVVNLAEHEAQGRIHIPEWLRDKSTDTWKNLWSDEPFEMPSDQWDAGWWTLHAQGSQIIVVANAMDRMLEHSCVAPFEKA
jgi:glycosidase